MGLIDLARLSIKLNGCFGIVVDNIIIQYNVTTNLINTITLKH